MADKSTNLADPVPIRLTHEDRRWLKQEADRRDRSLSYLVREAVREKRERSAERQLQAA